LGIEAKALGERALIVSDPGVSAAGLLDLVLGPLQAAGLDVATFSDVESNPTIGNVEATVAAIDAHHADLLIAVGGGSPIDTAKAAVLVAANGGTITDYEGFNIAERAALPLLAIPSTCGTGSEVTKGSVITDPGAHHKMVIVDDGLYPRSAFLDARMIETLPAHLVAATGVDALTHAIEGFITPAANAFSDALNIDAIGRVARHLRPATAGSAPDRYEMMVTASMAGAGFHNVGLGLVHALAVTAGGPIRHGLCADFQQ
jgi:alcohol dehydrogenase class IV